MKRREALRNLSTFVALMATRLRYGAIAEAQQATKIFKIGWLGIRRPGTPNQELFKRELGALGYVEGKNITYEYLTHNLNKPDQVVRLAAELARLKVDVIVISSTANALAIKNDVKTIPIVLLGGGDPVADGLVDSLARPGGNITGVTNIAPQLAGKRLELLKETMPKLSRVAVLRDPQGASSVQQWNESQLAARQLGLQLHSMEVKSADNFEIAFKEAIKARSAALSVTSSTLINVNQKQIAEMALKNRLPAIHPRADFVENGGLMSYGPITRELYQRAAVLVDKILKGSKPADLPVEQPMAFELVINFKTAKALGLTIPPIVLMRVTRVVK